MKFAGQFPGQVGWPRGAVWLLMIVVIAMPACKKRQAIALDPDDEAQPDTAARTLDAGSKGPPASAASQGSRAAALSKAPSSVALPRSAIVDVEPDKASTPVFGFPVPESMKLLLRGTGSEVYESRASLKALERFYKRELGRDGAIEPRGYGFRVTLNNDVASFMLVTQPPGADRTRIAIVAGSKSAPATSPESSAK